MHLSGAAKPAFALVATHGLTDLDSLAWVAPYGALALLPIPTEVTTALFCAASLFHFSDDFGKVGSLAVHTGVLLVGLVYGVQAAFMTMLAYLTLFHVPSHYARCALRGRSAWRATLAVGAAAAALSLLAPEVDLAFGDELQRLVTAHVAVEAGKR